jgi:hypothetical protein
MWVMVETKAVKRHRCRLTQASKVFSAMSSHTPISHDDELTFDTRQSDEFTVAESSIVLNMSSIMSGNAQALASVENQM